MKTTIKIFILLLLVGSCANRKTKIVTDKQNIESEISIKENKASNKILDSAFTNSKEQKKEEILKNASFSNSKKTDSIKNESQESQNSSKFAISLKNDSNILNQNFIGNLVLENGPNNKILIPISSGTDLSIEDSKSLSAKNNKLESIIKQNAIDNIIKESKINLLIKEKYSAVSHLDLATKENTDLRKQLEIALKNKDKNTSSEGLGFWGYFWLIISTAILSILLWEYLKTKYYGLQIWTKKS